MKRQRAVAPGGRRTRAAPRGRRAWGLASLLSALAVLLACPTVGISATADPGVRHPKLKVHKLKDPKLNDPSAPDHCRWRTESYGSYATPVALLFCRTRAGRWVWAPTAEVGLTPEIVKAARDGDPSAMATLGSFYFLTGQDARDPAAAKHWLMKAAAKGETRAMFGLAALYAGGYGVKEDPPEAARWARQAAEAGNLEAMYLLGRWCEQGFGVPKDDAEAARWYLPAAEKGHRGAMLQISTMYREGRGLPKDPAEAERWFQRVQAADQAMINSMGH